MNTWEQSANYINDTYNALVDWVERFYICPECGELVDEEDWEFTENGELCPVCGLGEEE